MAEAVKKQLVRNKLTTQKSTSMISAIKGRQTPELIIAVCGSVGSGTSTIANYIKEIFENEYSYPNTEIIKISDIISKYIHTVKDDLEKDEFLKKEYVSKIDITKIDIAKDINALERGDRIALLQSAGNALRKKSMDILAQLAIKEIAVKRVHEEPTLNNSKLDDNVTNDDRVPRKNVTIIDSLKNPSEVELLQLVYNDMFYLFGVLCPEEIRQKRLVDGKGIDEIKATQLMSRDKSEDEEHGQQLLKTIFYSDFFIKNSDENIDSLRPKIRRYIKILMGDKTITPTFEENAMFHAQSAAVKSGCLSKQVGAAIMDSSGKIISTGYNDVPKAGGGLYTAEDKNEDSRCMFKYSGKCINSDYKDKILSEIDVILNNHLSEKRIISDISNAIRKLNSLKGLTEFCRAIHAEMDAITSVARNGTISLKGTSIFSTTFPCHNCARHIIATGIKKVYYIEPYEKSLALKLHQDAISLYPNGSESNSKKVEFIPFEGVSPRKYLELFRAEERKKNGSRADYSQKTALPAISVLLDTRYEYESKIIENLVSFGFGD